MGKDQTKVMAGVGKLFVAPYGEAFPAETGATLSWGGNWLDIGYTKGGAEIALNTEWFDIEVDQESLPIGSEITKQTGSMKCALAQTDADALLLAIPNAAKSTVAAGAAQVGKTLAKVGSGTAHSVYTVGFETKAPGSPVGSSYWRMFKFYRCVSVGVISVPYRKGEVTVLNLELKFQADSTRMDDDNIFSIVDMTAPTT